ncbi:MAG TPA: carboxypeptidase regulatory-like domain-containing protein [Bacteroidota bacterium]|nr:carboxypeptidase regulatory-like domain-containing protein [Bacteroidota bacterium]
MKYASAAVGALVFACACSAVAGDVAGKVSFTGTAPKMARIMMNADPVCVKQHKTPVTGEEVVVNKNGTLRNVLIYVKEGLGSRKFDAPASKVEFDQKGCMYDPHVVGIQTGQELDVVNSDPTLHNVHSLSKENPQFNVAQPKQGMRLAKKFDKPEVFKVKCEVHTWMGAYIGVFSHPFYAVTGDDGTFHLKGLPAGQYTIEAWHEKYGTQQVKVTVAASGAATADFTYQGK